MSKKIVVSVILWLTLSFSLLAQAPVVERTKSATSPSEEAKPCWEDLSRKRTFEEKKTCYGQYLVEVDLLIISGITQETLEALELSGVRFLKGSFGSSDEVAAEMVARHISKLKAENESALVAKTSPPTVSEKTSESQKELVSRVVPTDEKPLVVVKELCWEETHSSDPVGCLAHIEKRIVWLKAEKTKVNKKQIDRDIKLLKVDKKRIEKQSRYRIKVARAQEKREEREIRAENYADVFCPDSRKREEVEILNTNHFIFNRFQAFNRVTISNPFGFPVRIFANDPNRNSSGAVADLPGGCTITLSRSIRPFLETSGYSTLQYHYSAQAIDSGNHRGIARSQYFSLYPGNGYQQMNSYTWVIGNFQLNY